MRRIHSTLLIRLSLTCMSSFVASVLKENAGLMVFSNRGSIEINHLLGIQKTFV